MLLDGHPEPYFRRRAQRRHTWDDLRGSLAQTHAVGPLAPLRTSSTKAAASIYPSAFAIGFDRRDRVRLHELWDEVLDSNRWTEGEMLERFEASWETWNGLPSLGFSGWAGASMAVLEFVGIKGETVLCPSNTFIANPLAVLKAGGRVEFVDCNRDDLCLSAADFQAKAEKHKPKAAWLVHIGGHIAFDVAEIAAYCSEAGIFLIEDCAHAHGASWNGQKPGSWGDAGVYSLYATKTISTGEGGVLVSRNQALREFARGYRNYGKPSYDVEGLNYRMSELQAVMGRVQLRKLDAIVDRRNRIRNQYVEGLAPGFRGLIVGRSVQANRASSTTSKTRPEGSMTLRAIGCSGTRSTCPIPTGWPGIIPACRCTTTARRCRISPTSHPKRGRLDEGPGNRRRRVRGISCGRGTPRARS